MSIIFHDVMRPKISQRCSALIPAKSMAWWNGKGWRGENDWEKGNGKNGKHGQKGPKGQKGQKGKGKDGKDGERKGKGFKGWQKEEWYPQEEARSQLSSEAADFIPSGLYDYDVLSHQYWDRPRRLPGGNSQIMRAPNITTTARRVSPSGNVRQSSTCQSPSPQSTSLLKRARLAAAKPRAMVATTAVMHREPQPGRRARRARRARKAKEKLGRERMERMAKARRRNPKKRMMQLLAHRDAIYLCSICQTNGAMKTCWSNLAANL